MAHGAETASLVAGRYVIERELGRGATATVLLARDLERESALVALKILRVELADSVTSSRFLREIQLTQSLAHPSILPVFDAGQLDDGRPFCVLPYVAGGTLRALLEREHQLPIDRAVEIAKAVARALDAAHTMGLQHRDVKPENILLDGDTTILADFGIARALEHVPGDTTSSGIVRGTPAYMSPEQASGDRNYDGRSDIYSLGCVLYEMLAGVATFVGPTPQSVIAQRFISEPRDVRVYRPSVTPALAAVVARALATVPADRHASAREFADALDAAMRAGSTELRVHTPWRTRRWALGALAVAAAVSSIVVADTLRERRASVIQADTSRIAVLPFEDEAGVAASGMNEMMYEALGRWTGVTLVDPFQVSDAIRRRPVTSDDDAREVAQGLGAGRFVRGRVTRVGDSLRVYAALYDLNEKVPLHQAMTRISAHDRVTAAWMPLADSLLFRGRAAEASDAVTEHSLPAAQAFSQALRALDDWELARADSLFESAVSFEARYARARFWNAQVRAWRGLPVRMWRPLVDEAMRDTARLPARERRLAEALAALAAGSYSTACRLYGALTNANDRDFAAWYGFAQCHQLDRLVRQDSHSPSGWAFRSSFEQAARGYARALELLPSTHQGFRGSSYSRVRELLYTTHKYRPGFALNPDTVRFLALPSLNADTLVFIPYPLKDAIGAASTFDESRVQAALGRQSRTFRHLTSVWGAALPQNANVKEAVAVSLEMLGDPSAVDTLVLARALTSDLRTRFRLAAREAVLRLKLDAPDRVASLRRAVVLADSLLADQSANDSTSRQLLLALAAMRGRCDAVLRLTQAPRAGEPESLAPRLVGSVMGCSWSTPLEAIDRDFLRSLDRRGVGMSTEARALAEYQVLGQFLPLVPNPNTAITQRLAAPTNDFVLQAWSRLQAGRKDSVRATLAELARTRASSAVITPDALLSEAHLWLSVGDTARAVQWLDRALETLKRLDPATLDEPVYLLSVMQAMKLRVRLAPSPPWNAALNVLQLPVPSTTMR